MSLILDDDYPEAPGIIARLADEILTRRGVEKQLAGVVAMEIAEAARVEFQGTAPYWNKDTLQKITARDREIYAKFTGKNHAQLAHEYNLTTVRIYTIIKRVQLAEFTSRQGSLSLE